MFYINHFKIILDEWIRLHLFKELSTLIYLIYKSLLTLNKTNRATRWLMLSHRLHPTRAIAHEVKNKLGSILDNISSQLPDKIGIDGVAERSIIFKTTQN